MKCTVPYRAPTKDYLIHGATAAQGKAGSGDYTITILGSFTMRVWHVIDCEKRCAWANIFVENTWSTQSLTRNPLTRKPFVSSNLLEPVEIEIRAQLKKCW